MNLEDIYREEGFAGLKRLAKAAGTDPQYLRQCAKRWRGKRPSPELAWRLIAADPRLTFEALYAPVVDNADSQEQDATI